MGACSLSYHLFFLTSAKLVIISTVSLKKKAWNWRLLIDLVVQTNSPPPAPSNCFLLSLDSSFDRDDSHPGDPQIWLSQNVSSLSWWLSNNSALCLASGRHSKNTWWAKRSTDLLFLKLPAFSQQLPSTVDPSWPPSMWGSETPEFVIV